MSMMEVRRVRQFSSCCVLLGGVAVLQKSVERTVVQARDE